MCLFVFVSHCVYLDLLRLDIFSIIMNIKGLILIRLYNLFTLFNKTSHLLKKMKREAYMLFGFFQKLKKKTHAFFPF